MMIIIMSVGRDYVSELRQRAGLLVIYQVIYDHGGPWWNDIDRGTSDSSTRALANLGSNGKHSNH
jgi:hypothetical protein